MDAIEKKRKRDREYHQENREKRLAQFKTRAISLKQEMIAAYGGKCSCCGESRFEFLTLDHVNGGGKSHRSRVGGGGAHLYADLKRRGWPQGEYQLLCFNCNTAKFYYGTCPHQQM
jgi:hypothetical protein